MCVCEEGRSGGRKKGTPRLAAFMGALAQQLKDALRQKQSAKAGCYAFKSDLPKAGATPQLGCEIGAPPRCEGASCRWRER